MQVKRMSNRMGRKEEAPMLRLSHDQPSLWESVLPPELFQMGKRPPLRGVPQH